MNTLLTPTRSLITRKRELFRLLSYRYVCVLQTHRLMHGFNYKLQQFNTMLHLSIYGFFVTACSCARTKMKTRILHGIVFSSRYESRVLKRPVNTLLTPTRSLITRKRQLLCLLSHWCVCITYDFHWTTRANKNICVCGVMCLMAHEHAISLLNILCML